MDEGIVYIFILTGVIILYGCCYAIKSLIEIDGGLGSTLNGGQTTRVRTTPVGGQRTTVQRAVGPRRSPRRTPATRTVTRKYYYQNHFPYNDTTIINVDGGTPSYFDTADELIRLHNNTFTNNCKICGDSACTCGNERRDDGAVCDDDRGDCCYDGGGDDGGNDGGGGYDGGDSGGGYDAGDSGGGYDAGDSGGGYNAGDSGGGYDAGDSGGGYDGGGDSGGGDFGGDDYLE